MCDSENRMLLQSLVFPLTRRRYWCLFPHRALRRPLRTLHTSPAPVGSPLPQLTRRLDERRRRAPAQEAVGVLSDQTAVHRTLRHPAHARVVICGAGGGGRQVEGNCDVNLSIHTVELEGIPVLGVWWEV